MPRLIGAILIASAFTAVGCSVGSGSHPEEAAQNAPPETGQHQTETSTTTPPSSAETSENHQVPTAAAGSFMSVEESIELLELGALRPSDPRSVFRAVKVSMTNREAGTITLDRSAFSLRTTHGIVAPMAPIGAIDECQDGTTLPSESSFSCTLYFTLHQYDDVLLAFAMPRWASVGTIKASVPAPERCHLVKPLITAPVKVRVSNDVAYDLGDVSGAPDGVYVLDHSELYTERSRPNFTTPASTIVIRDGAFHEVEVIDGGLNLRSSGELEDRASAGGDAKLSCTAPTVTHRTTDTVSFTKRKGEVVLERKLEGDEGVLRRYYRPVP